MTEAEKPVPLGDVRPESQRTLTPSNASVNPDLADKSKAKDEEANLSEPSEASRAQDGEEPQPVVVSPTSDVEAARTEKDAENAQSDDPNAVGWDGPDDPANPMNWSSKRKWCNICALSLMTLLT